MSQNSSQRTPMVAMRPSVIKDRILRHEKYQSKDFERLKERDTLHRELNRKYGYSNPGGSFGIGKKSQVDTEYAIKYDEIESHYRVWSENERAREVHIDNNTLSIFEFLLFDNIGIDAREAVLSAAEINVNATWYDFIEVRAAAEIDDWSKEYSVGNIRNRIRAEERLFRYSAKRCRKALGISKLNIAGNRAILDFKHRYMEKLNVCFGGLIVSS